MLPDIINYVPDPKNGRPIANGKVYFLIAGYLAPDRDSDLDVTKIAPVTANGSVVPQPIYTSQGGALVVGSQVNQPQLIPDGTVNRVAVYDKCGKLVYQVGYNAVGPFVPADALAAADSDVLIADVEAREIANKVLQWPESAQVFEQDLNVGPPSTPIFSGAHDAAQGYAFFNGKHYLMQKGSGPSYTETELQRIVEYSATGGGAVSSALLWSSELSIGHQGLAAFDEGGLKFVSGFPVEPGKTGGRNANKGYSVINWRGAATNQSDVTYYQLFGYQGSGHVFQAFFGATPTITPDRARIVIIAQNIEESVGYYLFVYDRQQVETAANPLDVMPLHFALLPQISDDKGYFSQGVATDGYYVYTFNGFVGPLMTQTVRKIDFNGNLIATAAIDGVRANYGRDQLLAGHPTWGCPRSMEPEGMAYDPESKSLLLMTLDNWRAYGDIVTRNGRNYAFMGTATTGMDPLSSNGSLHWVLTSREATAGEWSESATYSRGSATRFGRVIHRVKKSTGAANEKPLNSGIQNRRSIAQAPLGNSGIDVSFPYGEVWQLAAYSQNGEEYKRVMEYSTTARRLMLFDTRPEVDNDKFGSIYANYGENESRFEFRARTSIANSGGLNLYGSDDTGIYSHGFLFFSKGSETIFGSDTFGVRKPTITGAAVTPDTTPKQLGAATPFNQTIGTSIDVGYGSVVYNNTATSSGGFSTAKARGTEGAPAAVQVADRLGEIWFNGYTGTQFLRGAGILGIARGTISDTSMGGALQFRTQASGSGALSIRWEISEAGHYIPASDNVLDVGAAGNRVREFFAGNDVINTSDARSKTPVRAMSNAEIAAAKDMANEIGFYQWLDSVDTKGADKARMHCGMTVQRAIEIMQSHGLDPMQYGFICYDEWSEQQEIWNHYEATPALYREIPEVWGKDDLTDEFYIVEPARKELIQEAKEAGSELVQEYKPAGSAYSFRTGQLALYILKGIAASFNTGIEGGVT